MNSKSLLKFLAIVVLISIVAYVTVFGVYLGNYQIQPIQKQIKLGLDLRGGAYVILEAKDNPADPVTDEKLERAIATIRQRIDAIGVAEPIITRQGERRIRVELPEIQDTERALEIIGQTAQLEFRDESNAVVLSGNDIKKAEAVFASSSDGLNSQEAVVSLEMTTEGTKKFAEATKNNLKKIIAIYLDNEVISAPVVQSVITEGKAQISGNMNMQEAADLSMLIRAGALPVELETLQVSGIGPQLGANSFERAVFAAQIGIGLVFLFMLIYYKVPGLVANLTLVLYLAITLLILASMKATLTLPGIAGLVLSVGMAVDANVIIFERIKDELRVGKTLRSGIDAGFRRAFLTIIDANVTTIIAAVILFYFGSGPIRGFAITLIVGNITSIFTAVTVTRLLLKTLIDSKVLKIKSYFGEKGGQTL